jgi:hypothetical protein
MDEVTDPVAPCSVDYVNNRTFTRRFLFVTAAIYPEGLIIIQEEDSPGDEPMLVVTNEVSGSATP